MKGIVLAGGASSRFGGVPKGLALLDGRAMALHAADVLFKVCDSVAIEAPRGAGYETLGLPLVHAAPEVAGKGPLAALATGLNSGKAGGYIAFAPCDMPLLTREIFVALAKVGGAGGYARSPHGAEPLVAVLNTKVVATLLRALARDDLARTHVVLDQAGACPVDFADASHFENVNTTEDLARVEAGFRAGRRR